MSDKPDLPIGEWTPTEITIPAITLTLAEGRWVRISLNNDTLAIDTSPGLSPDKSAMAFFDALRANFPAWHKGSEKL